jgi:hypothetical protein
MTAAAASHASDSQGTHAAEHVRLVGAAILRFTRQAGMICLRHPSQGGDP